LLATARDARAQALVVEEDHRWVDKERRWGRRMRTGREEEYRRGRIG
jgi:hypothetical protein